MVPNDKGSAASRPGGIEELGEVKNEKYFNPENPNEKREREIEREVKKDGWG